MPRSVQVGGGIRLSAAGHLSVVKHLARDKSAAGFPSLKSEAKFTGWVLASLVLKSNFIEV